MKALKCEDEDDTVSNSYTFAIPEENWSFQWPYTKLELGQTLTISNSCNPNYVNDRQGSPLSCETIADLPGICSWRSKWIVALGVYNENDQLETFLQCPQCGCGAEGAANINDLYAAEQAGSRKVMDDEVILNEMSLE